LDELDEDRLCFDCSWIIDDDELDTLGNRGDVDPGEPDNEELGSPHFVSKAEAAAEKQDHDAL
jgi:hypothetical protein